MESARKTVSGEKIRKPDSSFAPKKMFVPPKIPSSSYTAIVNLKLYMRPNCQNHNTNAPKSISFRSRSIGAIRDYPPNCGRDASQLPPEECEKMLAAIVKDKSPRASRGRTDSVQEEDAVYEKVADSSHENKRIRDGGQFHSVSISESRQSANSVHQRTGSQSLGDTNNEFFTHGDSQPKFENFNREDRQTFVASSSEFSPSSSSDKPHDPDSVARRKVKASLELFRATFLELKNGKYSRRADLEAAKILKRNKRLPRTVNHIGHVPGVKVGDQFGYRIELAIVGLHRPPMNGIDFIKDYDGKSIAISIVASGGYADYLDDDKTLIYMGHGGNVACRNKPFEDQKLTRGNLALKNSIKVKNPVRVIRTMCSNGINPRPRVAARERESFVYDGLYLVQDYKSDIGIHGKRVFKFRLERMAGQPQVF